MREGGAALFSWMQTLTRVCCLPPPTAGSWAINLWMRRLPSSSTNGSLFQVAEEWAGLGGGWLALCASWTAVAAAAAAAAAQ